MEESETVESKGKPLHYYFPALHAKDNDLNTNSILS
jgi:hypothetical protein